MAVALIFNYLLCAGHRILMYIGIRDRLTNLASVKTDEQIVFIKCQSVLSIFEKYSL